MDILIAQDGAKLATFDSCKELIVSLMEYFTEINGEKGERGLKHDTLYDLSDEVINTLVCVMYSGRHMIEGTSGKMGSTPDEEILLQEEEIGAILSSGGISREVYLDKREVYLDKLVSQKAAYVVRYVRKFLDYFESIKQKPVIDPSEEYFGEMMNWAVRYCLPRETYAPHDTIAYLRPLLPYLNSHTLDVMERDISEAEADRNLGHPQIDAPDWIHFLAEIRAELQKREDNLCDEGASATST